MDCQKCFLAEIWSIGKGGEWEKEVGERFRLRGTLETVNFGWKGTQPAVKRGSPLVGGVLGTKVVG